MCSASSCFRQKVAKGKLTMCFASFGCRQKVARLKSTMCSISRLKLAMFSASSGCKQKQAEVVNVLRVQAEGGQAEAGNVLPMCSASRGSRQKLARLKSAMCSVSPWSRQKVPRLQLAMCSASSGCMWVLTVASKNFQKKYAAAVKNCNLLLQVPLIQTVRSSPPHAVLGQAGAGSQVSEGCLGRHTQPAKSSVFLGNHQLHHQFIILFGALIIQLFILFFTDKQLIFHIQIYFLHFCNLNRTNLFCLWGSTVQEFWNTSKIEHIIISTNLPTLLCSEQGALSII